MPPQLGKVAKLGEFVRSGHKTMVFKIDFSFSLGFSLLAVFLFSFSLCGTLKRRPTEELANDVAALILGSD
jgi:hypothetical protein